jgi:hypothetical protein
VKVIPKRDFENLIREAYVVESAGTENIQQFLVDHPTLIATADQFFDGFAEYVPSRYRGATHFPNVSKLDGYPVFRRKAGHTSRFFSHHYGLSLQVGRDEELFLLFRITDPEHKVQEPEFTLYSRHRLNKHDIDMMVTHLVPALFMTYVTGFMRPIEVLGE